MIEPPARRCGATPLKRPDSLSATATAPRTDCAPTKSVRSTPTETARNEEFLRADADLAKRCVDGEVAAWEELYAQCHQPLLVSIEMMLRPNNADRNLVDELAARAWYAQIGRASCRERV